jgi:hypothetical protein
LASIACAPLTMLRPARGADAIRTIRTSFERGLNGASIIVARNCHELKRTAKIRLDRRNGLQ